MKKILAKSLMILMTVLMLTGLTSIASDLVIESNKQTFSEKDNKIKFEGDVKVKLDDIKVVGEKADVEVTKNNKLDVATFYEKPYAYEVKNNKKREVKANILKVSLINKIITAKGDTQTTVFEGEYPAVIITADNQEYDTNTHVMVANGEVIIRYKEIETFSNKAIIRTDKKGDLKKIDLIGNARIKQEKHVAMADKFVYMPDTEEMLAMGNVTSDAILDDGSKLILKSKYQQYDRKSNTFSGSGDVKIWFKDYYAEGPKVTFYPDKKTNKPNEIYFTGRSSLTQGLKTIYADKIKLVLKPKNFFAEGNTKTVIRDVAKFESDDAGF